MELCSDKTPQDSLEDIRHVVTFLCQALCGARETPFNDTALCGAQLVFWAVVEDMEALRERIVRS